MTLANIKDVRSLIAKYSFRPLKHLGQNFLVSEKVLEIFISACSLTKKDAVLEIGPGIGTITRELAKRCRTVLAIEKDERLLPILKENVREFRNVSITLSDARRLSPNDLPIKKYHLVASFPYYAAAYLLNHFLISCSPPQSITAIIQKEIAERIISVPPHGNRFSSIIQYFGAPTIIAPVPRSAFFPEPHVDSAIIRIRDIENQLKENPELTRAFLCLIRFAFISPRKQLVPQLSRHYRIPPDAIIQLLTSKGYTKSVRPQEIALPVWRKLAIVLASHTKAARA